MRVKCSKCGANDPIKGCGREFCPHFARSTIQFNVGKQLTSDNFQSQAPAPFIGRFGYPDINVGVLAPPDNPENAWEYDAPRHWAQTKMSIPNIMNLRSSLINSRFKANIKAKNTMMDIAHEVGMASKPVELEVNLDQKPKFAINADNYAAPMGPNASLQKAQITSNPKISHKVEKITSDTDLKATGGLTYLNKKGFDENFLSKLLSVGMLGTKQRRKLVPTRWSITATDDTLGKNIIKEIKDYNETDYQAFFGSHLGNFFLILFFPDVWQYELFEMYQPSTKTNQSQKLQVTTDYEPYAGRKHYAFETAGGYYAARLPILEKLREMKRQSSILTLRVITDDYSAPLGVWVVREATRNAMTSKPIQFSSKELMLTYAKHLLKKKFNINLDDIVKKSLLLSNLNKQSKLKQFF